MSSEQASVFPPPVGGCHPQHRGESFSLRVSSNVSPRDLVVPGSRRSVVDRSGSVRSFISHCCVREHYGKGLWLFRIFSVSALRRCGRSAYVLEIIGAPKGIKIRTLISLKLNVFRFQASIYGKHIALNE